MQIRTITAGVSLDRDNYKKQLDKAVQACRHAEKIMTDAGYIVQSVRIASQPWPQYTQGLKGDSVIALMKAITTHLNSQKTEFFNPGPADEPDDIRLIPDIINNTHELYCSSRITRNGKIDYKVIEAIAGLIAKMSTYTKDGWGNFRFAAIANMPPGSPYFPGGYHDDGPLSLSLGMENGDLLHKAFRGSKNLEEAETKLQKVFENAVAPLEDHMKKASSDSGAIYGGIDVSIAPSLKKDESVAHAFELLEIEKFGDPGTLSIAAMITKILKGLPIKVCGYSGLMLPVLEDPGIALRNDQGCYNISNLLTYSTVCGTGLDTIPLQGDASTDRLKAVLWDVATLSLRLDKPLSARLIPVEGKKAGQMTEFESQYIVNTNVMKL